MRTAMMRRAIEVTGEAARIGNISNQKRPIIALAPLAKSYGGLNA